MSHKRFSVGWAFSVWGLLRVGAFVGQQPETTGWHCRWHVMVFECALLTYRLQLVCIRRYLIFKLFVNSLRARFTNCYPDATVILAVQDLGLLPGQYVIADKYVLRVAWHCVVILSS